MDEVSHQEEVTAALRNAIESKNVRLPRTRPQTPRLSPLSS